MTKQQIRDEPAQDSNGSLYRGHGEGNVEGSHPGRVLSSSLYTRAVTNGIARGAMIASMGVAAAALVGSLRSRR